MTPEEFSNQYDVLVNSYRRFKAFDSQETLDSLDFDEYEKSLYLTKAQEEVVLSLYSGRNSSLQSFEETEELRRYLSELIGWKEEEPIENTSGTPIGIDSSSTFFTLPEDLWFITYEAVNVTKEGKCEGDYDIEVVPVTQDEYHKIKNNPFRGTNTRRALRLDFSNGLVEIVCKYKVNSYYFRYLKKLSPIVLEDMPNGLTIGGISKETPCKLHEGLHQRILERAVEIGIQSKSWGVSQPTQRRETNRE